LGGGTHIIYRERAQLFASLTAYGSSTLAHSYSLFRTAPYCPSQKKTRISRAFLLTAFTPTQLNSFLFAF
jgi:hypothetical protein